MMLMARAAGLRAAIVSVRQRGGSLARPRLRRVPRGLVARGRRPRGPAGRPRGAAAGARRTRERPRPGGLRVRPGGDPRPADGASGPRDRRRGWSQPPDVGPSGLREDDAGPLPPRHPPRPVARGDPRRRRPSIRPAGLRPGACCTRGRSAAPHHTASDAALVGGGALPRPGEISLAHNGVLFLDELPEFRRPVLEALRQPLEERTITLVPRPGQRPAARPLPARRRHEPVSLRGACPGSAPAPLPRPAAYARRISGPLLDRIDLQVEVAAVSYAELTVRPGEASAAVAGAGRAGSGAAARPHGRGWSGHQRRPRRRGPAAPGRSRRRGPVPARERGGPAGLSARGHDRILRRGPYPGRSR